MFFKLYANDSESGGAGNNLESGEGTTPKFPEDPGMKSGRVPDGGGPADGFINEEGHYTGEGFLGHVKENDSSEKSLQDNNREKGNG